MKKFEELKEILAEAEKDAAAFYQKGNKAAGTRLRVAFQKVKVVAQEIRQEVTELKNKAE
jgi:vacuolar-type H+-ATPase subunit E/Vma4